MQPGGAFTSWTPLHNCTTVHVPTYQVDTLNFYCHFFSALCFIWRLLKKEVNDQKLYALVADCAAKEKNKLYTIHITQWGGYIVPSWVQWMHSWRVDAKRRDHQLELKVNIKINETSGDLFYLMFLYTGAFKPCEHYVHNFRHYSVPIFVFPLSCLFHHPLNTMQPSF